MQQQEWYLSQISLLPKLFPVNTILVRTVNSVFKVVLKLPTNFLCAKQTSTLIVTLNFTAIPTLFLVLLPVHYHPVSMQHYCVHNLLLCTKHVSAQNCNYNFLLLPLKYGKNSLLLLRLKFVWEMKQVWYLDC